MDTFSALVIYTGLLALSRRPDAWRNNESILLTREDLEKPGATSTWRLLAEIGDPEIDHVVQRLRSACRPQWQPDGDLERLLHPETVTATAPVGTPADPGPPPIFEVSANPDLRWFDEQGRPADDGGTRTGARPTDAAEETTFSGVRGTAAFGQDPEPESAADPDPEPPDKPVNPATVMVSAAIALVLGLFLGAIVGSGQGPAVGVITAVVTFAIALPLLRHRL